MNKKRFFASILSFLILFSSIDLSLSAFAVKGEDTPNTDGLVLAKTAVPVGDGYKIRMEAYTTGKVTTSETTVPVDVVLVLDQSGSMAYSFGSTTRQAAMKQAVKNFINSVGDKYSYSADHRMAIVTFGSDAHTLQNWTNVDENGKNMLINEINGLPSSPSGATNAGAGMEQAETLMNSGYTGNNTERQKVVVFFTDGVPTTSDEFSTSVADAAIRVAQSMKNSGVTVYSVGIFNGANPLEMYGESGFDTNSNGEIDSKWIKETWGLLPGTDFPEADRPAGNRFLNLLSNNYQDASGLGLRRETEGFGILHYKITYTITQNFNRTASSYYLTADDEESLKQIFKTISDNIQTSNIDLGADTVIRDVVTPYFTMPADASKIKVYTAAAKADGSFDTPVPANGITTEITDNTVSVSGFDFNENFVAEEKKDDGTYGQKLIIEFTVEPKDGFLGGNNVPTNDKEKSGVYKNATATNPLKPFPLPEVNVPIPEIKVTAENKNVYLMSDVPAEELKEGVTATCNGVNLLDKDTYTGENAWKAEFVEVTVGDITVKDKDDNTVTGGLSGLKEDGTYTFEVKVEPKTSIEGGVTAQTGKNDPPAKINVFKPELTFKDYEGYYGDTVPTFSENPTQIKWKHEGIASTDASVTMTGTEPALGITYTPEEGKIENGKINSKQDIPVKAEVKIKGEDVNTYTTFKHQACTSDCGWTEPTKAGDPAFLLHVKTCELAITKSGGDANEPYVFTVNKDGQPYTEVTIVGNGNVTIKELPVGTYTITEDEGWSWRYNANINGGATLSANSPNGTITCTNAKKDDHWLNGFSAVVRNIFGQQSNTATRRAN